LKKEWLDNGPEGDEALTIFFFRGETEAVKTSVVRR
jgi:hypothetical protein